MDVCSPSGTPPGGEATYSLSDQPTNQPTSQPTRTEYISIRVTVDHTRLSDVISVFDGVEFAMWPHMGREKDNPHYHILVMLADGESGKKVAEKMRKRIKDRLGLQGAGKVMVKIMDNPIVEAVTYCSKEGTTAVVSDVESSFHSVIASAPAWVDRVQQPIQKYLKAPVRKPVHEDHYFQITYQNMEKVCYRYHCQHGTPKDLAATLEHMHKNGWRLNIAVIRGGIPSTFFDQFEAMCRRDTIWKKSRFEFMRVAPNYNRG